MGYRLDPRLINNYEYPSDVLNLIQSNNKIYLSTNPNIIDGKINVAILELANSISLAGLDSNTKMIESFTEDSNPINPEVPLKSCDSKDFVIEFNIVDRNEGVFIGDNCIQINAINSDRLINYADAVGYGLVGIN